MNMTARRFVEQIRWYYPGRELVTEARLSLHNDPYLKDYLISGKYVFPEVMAMEAISQIARLLASHQTELAKVPVDDTLDTCRFERVRFNQQLNIDKEGCVLRCRARMLEDNRVEVTLQSSHSHFATPLVTATCCFEQEPRAERAQNTPSQPNTSAFSYAPVTHHGNEPHRFICLDHFEQLDSTHCQAVLNSGQERTWFCKQLPEALTLAKPQTRQAAIDVLQAWIPHLGLQPKGFEAWHPGDLNAPGPWLVDATERRREDGICYYDVNILTATGEVREQWIGLQFDLLQ